MGSLNGDVVVMRNGRSTSQVSIYNYPEHLNPFYEEDQHKRLRFWKISKKDNEGRRNSFSIGNLKEMWAFKSFRSKKKSSTLGITKTSESPPPMRREYVVDNGWNSFDHRLRDGDSFQRNAGYRSSLQNLPSNNQNRMGFNRNDDYRSTMQVPRPNPRLHQQQKPQPQPRRSSQSSMVSTNPFESDIEDDNEDANALTSLNGGSTTTLSKSTPRKKRRAPAPPAPIHGRTDRAVTPTIVIESSQNDTPDDLCIREDMDIANLTAEIESFVKDKTNEDIETVVITEHQTTKTAASDTKPIKDVDIQEKIKTSTTITTTTTAPTTDANNVAAVGGNVVITNTPPSHGPVPVVAGKELTQVVVKTTQPPNQAQSQTNGQVTTEVIAVKTTTTSAITESVKPAKGQKTVTSTAESVAKTEIKSNGAIPKKSSNAAVANPPTRVAAVAAVAAVDLSISEQPQSPKPAQRAPKSDTEVGHVECIHVHVESPRATPREDHANGVSSFKNEQNIETEEVITTKTPFILTSPPRQRKSAPQTVVTKESVNIVQSPIAAVSNELNIREEQVKPKPEIMAKPALSPKPQLDRNGKVNTFAEIHKPRGNKVTHTTVNGHVTRTSRDEVVTPPTVPQQQEQQVVERIVVATSEVQPKRSTENKVVLNEAEVPTPKLKIEEAAPAAKQQQREMHSPPPAIALTIENNVVDRPGTNENSQFESLYRPQSHLEWKRSTLAPLERNIPPEKRKSVKDIIEGINRSQRLLHASANKDFTIVTGPPSPSPNADNSDENLRILEESQREIRRMAQQIDRLDSTGEATTSNGTISLSSSPPPSYNECIAAHKLDNNEIFQKCIVKKEVYDYRESSPISSNLDWNPVPKPKRTKPQHE